MHGSSIGQPLDVHAGVIEDAPCLECHHPDHLVESPTRPPDFIGGVKWYNDDIR